MTESKADLELGLLKKMIRVFAVALDGEGINIAKLLEQKKAKDPSELRQMMFLLRRLYI